MSKYNKKLTHDLLFLQIAETVSQFSQAKRLQVGALIVSADGHIIATGFNGTPKNVPNDCEHDDITHEYVIHAEMNAIFNATTHNLQGSTIYLTNSPCMNCAAAIKQKQISRVIFINQYRTVEGIDFLRQYGVEVTSKDEISEWIANEQLNCTIL